MGARTQPDASTPVVSLKAGGTKTIVFIRHAESTWNRALKRQPFRLPTALADVDHAITHMGYAQSAALQRALRDTPASDASGLATAHRASAVWASPQTRALQTALVALQPLFQRLAHDQALRDTGNLEPTQSSSVVQHHPSPQLQTR